MKHEHVFELDCEFVGGIGWFGINTRRRNVYMLRRFRGYFLCVYLGVSLRFLLLLLLFGDKWVSSL